ncbi:RNA methyltransferase [Umezakia ovalisporum]|uniref:tRNA (cytidine/uridine-2'-O-)-methyltransferase TrmJ n=2 Tax=Umezakia ovalisporum TaxID=75695 RepID=A0AA43KFF7_9CYAN|nr:RNA methyltransferase [Umezakia ovalisporum]MBI1240328.1 TrmJ/YjtD family RNA methyltransferase [Nostoc sp. RI_552]MDH6058253.1 RNA methyltransferase [Umezakia ovalisporum FSS-43]MDH6063823.1 RNA methyltransferase [Umezakia ovalisporum FSS-62]MDH6066994.1 RNA methyltransferase [Umezakia ovalisporum APH033B]MDH6072366.1 RNA methyltransferase [Umezakia ovalisporum CobakiLakeA]
MNLTQLRIVLVEPAGPMNVGSIARVMKNFGLHNLVLVNPQCNPLAEEALKMAVHAKEILKSALLVSTLPEALQGCIRAMATTAIVRDWEAPLENPRTALPWLLESPEEPSALIFGRENRGLSNEELNYAQRFVRIPTSENYSSLNLASAVGICCYELAQYITPDTPPPSETKLATLDLMENYYQQLESLLLDIGYLYPHTANHRMAKFRQLYNRAHLQTKEVAMLRGILRQIGWAIKNRLNHENL